MATGPYTRTETTYWSGGSGNRKIWNYYWWYRNGQGPKVPHPFRMYRTVAGNQDTDAANSDAGYFAQDTNPPSWWTSVSADVHNKCYAKFIGDVRATTSQLGSSATVEFRQSEEMVRKRAYQLLQAARYLKRGYPFEFFKELGMLHRMPKRMPNRTEPKQAANWWLEWHFGWSPLIKDIYDSVQVLQAPLPGPKQIRGRAWSGPLIHDASVGLPDGRPWYTKVEYHATIREQMLARVSVTNPNLFLATSLGLTNPAQILWEGVPFSFVVDWFIPVGGFLSSWTDFLGLEVLDQRTTYTRKYVSSSQRFNRIWDVIYAPGIKYEGSSWHVTRELSIPGPSLSLRPYKAPSMTRAATAISLLLQFLPSLPR